MRRIKNNMNIRICGRADTTLSTIIIGDGRAAEQIPHDAQGRFIMEDGTVFQAYYFSDDTITKWEKKSQTFLAPAFCFLSGIRENLPIYQRQ